MLLLWAAYAPPATPTRGGAERLRAYKRIPVREAEPDYSEELTMLLDWWIE